MISKSEYPEWAKMPEDYKFSHENVDFTKYEKNFKFWTDAVWEKFKLKEIYWLYYKIFNFDPEGNRYIS